jgi:transposase-like protein
MPLLGNTIVKYPCPACQKNIYFPERHGLAAAKQEIVCQNCDRKYKIQYWQVAEGKKRQESLPVKKFYRTKIIDLDCYQLKVVNAEQRRADTLNISIPSVNNFEIFTGSSILTIFAKNSSKLLGIVDIENEQRYLFYSLRRSAIEHGLIWSAVTFLACFILAIYTGISKQTLQYILFLIPAVFGFMNGYSRWQNGKETDTLKLTRLRQEQGLLEQIAKLEERLERLEDDRHCETRLVDRLTAIKQEMISVDRDIYSAQIQTYSKGIIALHQQSRLTKDLIDRYQKVMSMLKIAYNTSQLEVNFPDFDLNNYNISTKLHELDLLERKREELVAEVELTNILR